MEALSSKRVANMARYINYTELNSGELLLFSNMFMLWNFGLCVLKYIRGVLCYFFDRKLRLIEYVSCLLPGKCYDATKR